jgi:MFS family permease
MLNKLIHRFIRPRHYWRDLGFDELTELYTSMMFRSLAVSLVAIFIPVYLYQNGAEVYQIFLFYTVLFAAHLLMCVPAALMIGKIGPKHTILVSYIFQAISMMGLIALNEPGAAMYLIAVTFGICMALFFTAFHTDFSKVKHSDHGGKEVSWIFIMQRLGAILGPIVGGIVAFIFGSQYIFLVALVLLFVGLIPLFLTKEPTRTNQTLDFKNFNIRKIKWDLISAGASTVEGTISVIVWPLFVGIFVFKDNPYIQLGSVASISVIASIIIARSFGKLVDDRKGRNLLRFGATSNALVHMFRPFANGFPSVLAINLVNEGVTLAYTLPYTKGVYDAADDHPGFRIVYLCALETVGAFTRLTFYAFATLAAFFYGASNSFFFVVFTVGALSSLVIMTERFRALGK